MINPALKGVIIQVIKKHGPIKIKEVHAPDIFEDADKYDLTILERLDEHDPLQRSITIDIKRV